MVPAGNVAIGTSIQTRAGPQLQLSTLVRHAYGQTVFNFTVEDFHTYFVGNSPQNALWVHNAGEFNCDGVVPDNGGDQNLPTDFDGEGAPADHNANDDVGKTPNSLKLTPAQNSLWEKGFQNSYAARESIPYDQRGYIDPRTGQPAPYERTIVTSEALKSRSSKQVAETFKPTISGGDIGSQANPSPAPNGFYTGDGTDGWGKFSADENGGYGNGTKPETHADVKTVDQWEHCANEHPNESYSFHMDIDHPKNLGPCEFCDQRIRDFVRHHEGQHEVEVTFGHSNTRQYRLYTWNGHEVVVIDPLK